MSSVNWATVRAFGELSLLSRASYASLVVVPIIARLWDRATDVTVKLSLETDELRSDIEQLLDGKQSVLEAGQEAGLESIDALAETGLNLITRIEAATAVTQGLPPELVLAFFAALFVVIGQVIYQVSCHDIVRRFKISEFGDHEQARYQNSPAGSQLEGALIHLRKSKRPVPEWLDEEMTTQAIQERPNPQDAQSAVRLGALAAYDAMASLRPDLAFLSLACFGAGLTLLSLVLLMQIGVVLQAA